MHSACILCMPALESDDVNCILMELKYIHVARDGFAGGSGNGSIQRHSAVTRLTSVELVGRQSKSWSALRLHRRRTDAIEWRYEAWA